MAWMCSGKPPTSKYRSNAWGSLTVVGTASSSRSDSESEKLSQGETFDGDRVPATLTRLDAALA